MKPCISFWFLSATCVLLCLAAANKSSYVYNEPGRLAAGLIHLHTGDYSVFHVNPPLPDTAGAIPAFCAGNYCPSLADTGYGQFRRTEYKAGEQWIEKNQNHLQEMRFGRYCMILFVVIGAAACYYYSKILSGYTSALSALLLWIFSPYILGHGCFICPDVPSASLAVLSVFAFHQWLKRPAMFEAMLAGLALGLAELTKFTLLIFYPLFIVMWLIYRVPEIKTLPKCDLFQQLKQLSVTFLISVFIINAGYLFEGTFTPIGQFKFQTALFTGCDSYEDVPGGGGNRFANSVLGYIPVPLPANYIQGIDTQRLDFERGLPSYLRGEWSNHGWSYYYLYALLLKTPLGTLGLFLLAIYCSFFIKECNSAWRDETVILLPGIVLLFFVSSQTGFSVHSRYIIPALPFFFIWMSKFAKCFELRKRFLSVLVSVLLCWSVLSTLWVYPHCISYFNELSAVIPKPLEQRAPSEPEGTPYLVSLLNSGCRNGCRHLLDSNIDWGQDLFELEKWCQVHPEVKNISAALWGSYPVEQTSIPITGVMPPVNEPQAGWYALSVNYLYDREKQYRYFLDRKPAARIGYSIYIYHITQEDIDRLSLPRNSGKQ